MSEESLFQTEDFSEDIVEKHIHDAKYFFELHKNEKAAEEAKKALAFDPSNTEALYLLGSSYYFLNEIDKAKEIAKQLLEIDPFDIQAGFLYGHVLLDMKEYDQAIVVFEQLIEHTPTVSGYYYLLALSIYLSLVNNPQLRQFKGFRNSTFDPYYKSQMDRAIHIAQQGLEVSPENAQLLGLLGRIHLHMGEFQESEKKLQMSLAIDPQNVTSCADYGNLQFVMGNMDEAKRLIDHGLMFSPNDSDLHFVRKRIESFHNKEKYYDYLSNLHEKYAHVYPNSSPQYLQLIKIKLLMGKKPIKELRKYVSSHPEEIEMQVTLGQLLYEDGQLKKALDHFLTLKKQYPNHTEIAKWVDTISSKGIWKIHLKHWLTPIGYLILFPIAFILLLVEFTSGIIKKLIGSRNTN